MYKYKWNLCVVVCVWVWVYVGESMCVSVCGWERECVSVCECVCEREREGEKVRESVWVSANVCVWEREGEKECVCAMKEEQVTPFIHDYNTNKIKNSQNPFIDWTQKYESERSIFFFYYKIQLNSSNWTKNSNRTFMKLPIHYFSLCVACIKLCFIDKSKLRPVEHKVWYQLVGTYKNAMD